MWRSHQIEKAQESEIQAGQAEPPALNWDDMKRAAQNAFTSRPVADYEAAIVERGEVREYGVGTSWFDRTMTLFENIYYGTISYMRDAWQKHVSGNAYHPAQNRTIELDRED